jgi:hypothetical protein
MTVDKSFIAYQHLVYLQEQQPTKKRLVELRKALSALKKECDLERKRLLKPEKVEVEEVKVEEVKVEEVKVEEVKVEEVKVVEPVEVVKPVDVVVDISSSQPIQDVKIKKKRKTKGQ